MAMFPAVLYSLRERDKLTQEELAKRLGISKSAVSMYECGKREPDFETVEKIADYFNVDINFLFTGVNSSLRSEPNNKEVLLMTTGQRMRSRRKELGISAEKVAERLGVSPATVYRYENGDIEKMPAFLLAPIASALKTSEAYLMGWSDDPAPVVEWSTTEEWDLLKVQLNKDYEQLNVEGQKKLASLARDLVASGNYVKKERYIPYAAYGQGEKSEHEMDIAQQMLSRAEELAELANKSDTVTLPDELLPPDERKGK